MIRKRIAAQGGREGERNLQLIIASFSVRLFSENPMMKWENVLKEMSVQSVGKFFWNHPLVLCLLLFLLILYKYFFTWFTLLVSTSPILLFTGFFLGIILAYGEPNNPENDHIYKKIEKTQSKNIHDNGKSVPVPRIPSNDEGVDKHNNKKKKKKNGGGSSSESGSDESDGSEIDTLPMLHAFHEPRPVINSPPSSQDGDSNDSSNEDGNENQEGNDNNEREKREDVKIVAWTADDEKNILKIGCLEIERNQRLESLIARRKARKCTDRNLVDFGSSESIPTIEDLSKFNVQIPTVFAPRKNPFDHPYNEDNFPDSAPSAPLKTRNTFDLPCETTNKSTREGNLSHMEVVPIASLPQRNTVFRRHESFTEGAPFLSDFWQDLQPSQFRPYFITEKMSEERISAPSPEGETCEKNSIQDSNSTSSASDQESKKEVLEDSSNRGQEPPFSHIDEHSNIDQNLREAPLTIDTDPPILISDSSDDDISLPGGHINDWGEAQGSETLSLSHSIILQDPSVMEYPQEMEMCSNEFQQISPHTNDLDLISSSTEAIEPFEVNSIQLPDKEIDIIDDIQIADPVYDSSPSGSEKPTSTDSPVDEALPEEGNACTSNDKGIIEQVALQSGIEVSSRDISAPSLGSMEKIKATEEGTLEIMENNIVVQDEGHKDPSNHADQTTSKLTDDKEMDIIDGVQVADPVYDSSLSGSEKPTSIGSPIDEAQPQEGNACTSDAKGIIEEVGLQSGIEVSSQDIGAPSLDSVDKSEASEEGTSEIMEHAIIGNDEGHKDSVSQADQTVSDISSQRTTSKATNGKTSGSRIISSSKKAVFGFFKR